MHLGPIQCIDAAEVFAATVALRFAIGILTIHTDSAFLIHGWEMGRAWCTAAKRTHADVWVRFWDAAEQFGIDPRSMRTPPTQTSRNT